MATELLAASRPGAHRVRGPGVALSPSALLHTSVESYRLEQRTEAVRQEIARLESDNQALATQVARARTDEYVELIARERLNMIRPGDRPLVMLREQPPAVPAQSLPAPAAVPQPQPVLAPSSPLAGFGHVGEWLNLFFGST